MRSGTNYGPIFLFALGSGLIIVRIQVASRDSVFAAYKHVGFALPLYTPAWLDPDFWCIASSPIWRCS